MAQAPCACEELGVEIEVLGGPVLLAARTYGASGDWVLAIDFSARIANGDLAPPTTWRRSGG